MSIDPAIRAGLAPRRRPGQPSATLDGDYFTLGSAVGPDQPNRREDVIKVETILGATGDYDIERFQGPLGHFGQPQANAVRSWQERNGYKSDATLFRDGPTITGLKRQAGGVLGGLTPPTPAEVDDHHQRLGRGEPGILNTRPARLSIRLPRQVPELDEQTHAFNADTARALTRTSVDGDVPNIYANHLKQAGAAGHATVLDLVEQVTAAEGRDRAERVLHAILGQLPPDQATAFLGGAMPPRRPLGVRDADLPRDDHQPLFARASAAADTEAARPVQLAQADTGTMTDAAPASAPQVQPPASPQPQAAKPVPSAGGVPTQGSKPVPNQMAQGQGGLARTQANAGTGTPPRDYGAIAGEFGLGRGMGDKAGAKTKEALDAMQAFRDGSDRSPAALNKVMVAAHKAASEDPEAARKIRGMLLDYKTNPVWQPRVMSETELKGRGAEDPAKRFGNLAGLSGGTAGVVGTALETLGHEGPGKAVGALGRGVSVPMGIAAGVDQVHREGLKGEADRRRNIGETDIPQQLGLKKGGDLSGAQDAIASMMAIRNADDKAAAVKQAHGKIADLKRQNPEAARVLEKQLGAFGSRPAARRRNQHVPGAWLGFRQLRRHGLSRPRHGGALGGRHRRRHRPRCRSAGRCGHRRRCGGPSGVGAAESRSGVAAPTAQGSKRQGVSPLRRITQLRPQIFGMRMMRAGGWSSGRHVRSRWFRASTRPGVRKSDWARMLASLAASGLPFRAAVMNHKYAKSWSRITPCPFQ